MTGNDSERKYKKQISMLCRVMTQIVLESHINHALVPKTHPPMYLMHKYWARKPHNVVREYIEHYTKKGDIVLDPFCGSGVTVLEALKADRSNRTLTDKQNGTKRASNR